MNSLEPNVLLTGLTGQNAPWASGELNEFVTL